MDNINYTDNMFEIYQKMFENSPWGICIVEIDGRINPNNAFCEMLGYTIYELLEKGWKDLIYTEDVYKDHESFDIYSTENNNARKFEEKFIRKDGTIILVKINAHSINYDGKTAKVVTVIDVTENPFSKQNLETEIAKLKSIIESTSDIIFSVDKNYCYTSFNSVHAMAMKNLYNVNIEIGKNLLDYQTSEEDRQNAKENIDKAFKGERIQEISISGKDLVTQKYFEVSYNPIKNENGEIFGVSIFAKDITETKIAIKQLEKSEMEFHTLFTEDLTGDFVSTAEGKIIICNPKFLEIFGFTSEAEALNTSSLDLYKYKEDRERMKDRILKEGKLENFELEMIRRDGKTISVLENIVGQFNKNGKLEKLLGYIIDVTEQKQAFEKIKQLSKAVEQSPATIIITDTEGNIEYVNQKGLDLTGYMLEELLGNNPRILSSGEMKKEEYRELWSNIKSGNEWRGEFHNKKKNGELYWESASISPIKNKKGEITNFLAVKEDITDRKKNEQELIAAKDKAEEINRIKSVFFSNMSHELRTPLVGILGFADILSNSLSDEFERNMASSILKSGKRLLNTLTSLLSLSELETLKKNIDLKLSDVNLLCKDIIGFYKVNSDNANVEFKIEFESETLKIKYDNRLLRDAINQIVENATKFTESGYILIKTYTINESEKKHNLGIIEVADTGIGIPKNKQTIIFDEFRQVSEGFGRGFEGTGLGLTLAKKYLEIMGARINVESEEGKGTKILITFPLDTLNKTETTFEKVTDITETRKNEIFKKTNFKIKDKRILLVENDQIGRAFIEKCLANLYHLESAVNGEQAIKLSTEKKFDLILMDINLGIEMDGTTAVKLIRKIAHYENTPIVAMTAFASNEDKEEFLSNGCSHYISKPFLKNDLVEFISNIFNAKVEQVNSTILIG